MKTISDWNGVKAEAVLAGSPAQAFNVMSDMLTDLRKYEKVNAALVAALQACRDELISIHTVHGDLANAEFHSKALRLVRTALAKAES